VLKGGANVCQQQLVNEVLVLLVTEFAHNLGCETALLTSACRLAIAYNRVGTGQTPSAVPSSSNFPASHLGSETPSPPGTWR
jgi:hypothetical protein